MLLLLAAPAPALTDGHGCSVGPYRKPWSHHAAADARRGGSAASPAQGGLQPAPVHGRRARPRRRDAHPDADVDAEAPWERATRWRPKQDGERDLSWRRVREAAAQPEVAPSPQVAAVASAIGELTTTVTLRDALPELCSRLEPADSEALIRAVAPGPKGWKGALAVYRTFLARGPEWMPSTRTSCAVLSVLAAARQADVAKRLVDELERRSCDLSVHVYNHLLLSYVRERRVSEALELAQSLWGRDVRPNAATYSSLVTLLGAARDVTNLKKARRTAVSHLALRGLLTTVVKMMRGFKPNRILYNALINALSKCHLYEDAEQVFERMRSDTEVEPDVVSYTAVLDLYGKQGKDGNLTPNVITYGSLLSAYAQQGLWQEAQELFDRMGSSTCPPNDVIYMILMEAYKNAGKPEEAAKVLQQMEAAGFRPSAVAHNTLIDAFAQEGNAKSAMRTYKRMRQVGLSPDTITFRALIEAFENSGRSEEATRLFEEVRASSDVAQDARACTALIAAYAKQGRVPEAARLYEDLRLSGITPTRAAFGIIIAAYSKAGRTQRVKDVFNEMLEAGVKPDSFTYSSLIVALVQAGEHDAVAQTILDMRGSKTQPNGSAYRALLHSSCQAASQLDIVNTIEEMVAGGHKLGRDALESILLAISRRHSEADAAPFMDALSVLASREADLAKRTLCTPSGCLDDSFWSQVVGELLGGDRELSERLVCSMLEALWSRGMRSRAVLLVRHVRQSGLLSDTLQETDESSLLDLRGLPTLASIAVLHTWLQDLHNAAMTGEMFPSQLQIILDNLDGVEGSMTAAVEYVEQLALPAKRRFFPEPACLLLSASDTLHWLRSKAAAGEA
eukprot:SM000391S15185  [mRNA]  locus=s391:5103:10493:+ [translate_table: standard]